MSLDDSQSMGVTPGLESFGTLLDRSPNGVALLNRERRVLHLNPAAERVLGQRFGVLSGRDALTAVHPDDRRKAEQAFGRLMAGGAGQAKGRFRILDRQGDCCWVDATAVNLLGEPSVGAVAVYFYEITAFQREIEESRANEELCRRILEAFAGGILVVSRTGAIIRANLEAVRFMGISREDLFHQTLGCFDGRVYREDGVLLTADEFPPGRCLRTGRAEPATTLEFERPDGVRVWALVLAMPFAAGEDGDPDLVVVSLLDITERKRMETALRNINAEHERIMASIPDGVWSLVVDTTGTVSFRYLSPVVEQITGRPLEYFTPAIERWLSTIHPEDRPAMMKVAERTLAGESTHEQCEYRVVRPDGTVRAVRDRVMARRLDDGSMQLNGVVSDITNLKESERKLRQSASELHSLSRRLIEVQETERRRLSRELHDQVGQALTAVQMNLQGLQEWPGVKEKRGMVTESMEIIDEVLDQVRNLSLDLRPLLLDDLGLVAALRWYTNRSALRAGMRSVFMSSQVPERLPPEVETACFRVAQEAVTNVGRHASARNVYVELRSRENVLMLSVRDDGVGLDIGQAREGARMGKNLGLIGMEERVHLVGGRLEFRSAAEGGTEVRVLFPLTPDGIPPKMGENDFKA